MFVSDGTVVRVVEARGTRCRIDRPIEGWTSRLLLDDATVVLVPVDSVTLDGMKNKNSLLVLSQRWKKKSVNTPHRSHLSIQGTTGGNNPLPTFTKDFCIDT